MAVSAEVMSVIRLLNEEGFGALAGEILIEIDLGREEEPSVDQAPVGFQELQTTKRIPFPEEDQLAEAMRILQLRLVEPARSLAEAERIAGALTDGKPIRILFVDDGDEGSSSILSGIAPPGDDQIPNQLDALLGRIARPNIIET
jgi:hypothetical protein